jgi:SRSO17 transposase
MDVELQVLKHLARDAQSTVSFIDQYCNEYKDLFPEVRSYECFKYLHLGIISSIPKKSLPEIAKVVGVNSAQSLHHFISKSPWSVIEIRNRRLRTILKALKDNPITVVIDETGDRKKGKRTDYVARQYLGSIGKIDSGIVSVNAYGIYQNMTFPLTFKIFKPQETLKTDDKYQTKIELASLIIRELIDFGFKINLVLADSLSRESNSFLKTLDKYNLPWIVSIRSDHGVLMPDEQRIRVKRGSIKQERIFSNQTSETRDIREIIFGKRSSRSYWEITTEPETMPESSTFFVMTNFQDDIKTTVENLYELRTWREAGFRQCQQELGWTDYRFTNFQEIEKWWEIIFCTYLMISLNSPAFELLIQSHSTDSETNKAKVNCSVPQQLNQGFGWKNALNNLRLLI